MEKFWLAWLAYNIHVKKLKLFIAILFCLSNARLSIAESGKLSSIQERSSQKPVAVIIAVTDEFAIENGHIELQKADLERKGYKVLVAQTAISRAYFSPLGTILKRRAREILLEKIRNLDFENNEKMKMLVIYTHGSSSETEINLDLLGSVSDVGLDAEATKTFETLADKASDDLRINLVSCSTFCGDSESTRSRALSFLNFFGAKNGSLFGAKTAVSLPTTRTSPSPFHYKIATIFYLVTFQAYFVYQVLNKVHYETPGDAAWDIFGTPALTVALATSLYLFSRKSIDNFLSSMGGMNLGTIFKFSNGVTVELEPASLLDNPNEIFPNPDNLMCHTLLRDNSTEKEL